MANTAKDKTSAEDGSSRKKAARPAAPVKPARQSPAERIQALEAEIERIRREEFDSRYNLIVKSIEELNGMGYKFRLVDESKGVARSAGKKANASATPAGPAAGQPGVSAHYDEKKYCKLCREHGHDQKAHARAGEFQNKAFSNEEKAQRGVLPPELAESFLAERQGA